MPGEYATDGVAYAQDPYAIVTFATVAYFDSGLTDAEKDNEKCEFLAFFGGEVTEAGTITDPVVYDMNAQEFDWDAGAGSSGVLVEEWQAWEGGLVLVASTASDRCGYSTVDLNLFQGMHFGFGLGPLSSYMTTEFESTDWWDDEIDPFSYFSGYVAMNHPSSDSDLGYDFIGQDFNSGYYSGVDMDLCADREDEAGEVTTICGGLTVDEEGTYIPGNHNVDVGSRHGYFQSSSWWYEDFPNLDLGLMTEGFTWAASE